ncbi:hypothetical protein [Marinomonas sp. IMCC 4694]|uniref:hypothetical protein n=1 Tax=Marinomonas sp. IMCC 4694 TaxID=2605432 RepID=UPI0011E7CF20|nr:hypothetical protein [Marinomonas sp. IMCC 4694]TYL48376.1 hypothetical protein FXV75_10730 [Marinomonas sp. IMCC 4694]
MMLPEIAEERRRMEKAGMFIADNHQNDDDPSKLQPSMEDLLEDLLNKFSGQKTIFLAIF